jgi:gliding motility-associated-like protein
MVFDLVCGPKGPFFVSDSSGMFCKRAINSSPQPTVTSPQGCTAEKSYLVEVVPKISIPSAFTPNGDGRNDVFHAIYGPDISDVRLSVFDRWGECLFTDPGTHQGWDGTVGGKKQPPGTYVWMFEYKDSTGISRVLKGTVELIR